ncbi:PQQ-binding-like beta-propeller repeat protein [Crateriforma spongiae]|uniref:PQQ-binding-like beta-propeller repeat protein n=1 Tax=Crateriforma spongiae TaxID=2724528 RepID=UPI0014454588|nr:PQQ-binding-like beta-propeller repeat protein [Crateriforma spongiae]
MRQTEFSATMMILGSLILGSITTASLSGCKPPQSTDVNVSTEPLEPGDNVTTGVETPNAGNTTVGAAGVVETPLAGSTPETAEVQGSTLTASVAEDTVEKIMAAGGDWPQWGGTRVRNNVPGVTGLPESWNTGRFDRRTGEWDKSRVENIRWYANLGSQTYGNPVVADGQVYVGTNNGAGYLKRYPAKVDLGCLLAFDEENGDFLWQHSSEKLITGRVHDWPLQGICCAPLVEGERLWFVTSRGEVRCLDTKGFYDNEDDGPVKNEPAFVASIMDTGEGNTFEEALAELNGGTFPAALLEQIAQAGEAAEGETAIKTVTENKVWTATGNFGGVDRELTIKQIGPRISVFKALGVNDKNDADTIWVFNMMTELGTSQHNMCSCSVTSYGDLLFVNTSNGQDESHGNLPAPDAPSFFCMNKNTGEVYWTDNSPGTNILHGQWSSPTVAECNGVPQVLFCGGDGWLYSFRADRGSDGNPELLWKFDCNPKTSKWILGGEGTRNNLIGTPVAYDGRVYIGVGQDPEHQEGEGHLWCIDPNKRGDVSPQLAVRIEGDKRVPIPHKRIQAVEPEKGEAAIDNPNSAALWHYSQQDQDGDGNIDFEEEMHRTCGTVAIKDGLLYIADFSGLVHCLDAKGTDDGQPIVHFTYDMLAQSWGSALISDGKVYVGDEDGDVCVFELGKDNAEPIEEINMGTSVYSTPVAANGRLYISTKDKLFAIEQE